MVSVAEREASALPTGTGGPGAALPRLAVGQPIGQARDAVAHAHRRAPAGHLLELAGVGDEVPLVARPPRVVSDGGGSTDPIADELEQLQEADGVVRSAPDVEHPSRLARHRALRQQQRFDQVVHEQDVADLTAIAIERDRPAIQRLNEEMRDPPLVLGADLVRAINAAHAEHDCRNAIGASVVADVLVGGALGAPVRAVEIERSALGDAAERDPWIGRLVAAGSAGGAARPPPAGHPRWWGG